MIVHLIDIDANQYAPLSTQQLKYLRVESTRDILPGDYIIANIYDDQNKHYISRNVDAHTFDTGTDIPNLSAGIILKVTYVELFDDTRMLSLVPVQKPLMRSTIIATAEHNLETPTQGDN